MTTLGKLLGATLSATLVAGMFALAPQASAAPTSKDTDAAPVVIAHRGASGYRPEHTLAAYELAMRMGADYVEPDLVSTKDGVLVARHENEIGGTTDVSAHPEFAARKVTKTIDGRQITGWFTEDFTLAELKTLRAKERLPAVRPANTSYDGQFEIPTLDEVLDLVAATGKRQHRTIGVYPETKHPTYFQGIGLALERPLVATLKRHHLDRPNAKVFLQSFETGNLKELNRLTQLPIVQLIDASGAPYDLVATGDGRTYADLASAQGLADIARYADGVGVNKFVVLPIDAAGNTGAATNVVRDAHANNLLVHIWTLRAENQFMAKNFRIGTNPNAYGDYRAEAKAFFDTGIDGAFTDHPDRTLDARTEWIDALRLAS